MDTGLGGDGVGVNDESPPKTYGELPPDAALSLLGSDVRASILWTLSEARGGRGPPRVLAFSDLRERVRPDVESSKFNYHLQKLVGTFVERVEPGGGDDAQVVSEMADASTEGFRLRPEGTTLVRSMRAWTVDGDAALAPVDVGLDCYHCGGSVSARYDHAIFAIQCPDCEYLYDYNLTPPGVLDGDERDLLDRVAEYNRHQRLAFARGSCPFCGGGVDVEFQHPPGTGYPRADLRSVLVRRGCDHCGHKDNLRVGEAMLADAGLVGFCHRRGLDVTTTPIWDLEFASTDRTVTVRSTDPWEVALSVTVDSDTLRLVVDGSLDVLERTET